jgi:hypothetical protein
MKNRYAIANLPPVLLVMILIAAPVILSAQEIHDARTYGSQQLIVHTISARAFTGLTASENAVVSATATGFTRYCSPASCTLVAPLVLPAGARVTQMILSACNETSSSADITVTSLRKPIIHLANGVDHAPVQQGPFHASPGCFGVNTTLASEVVDNYRNTYFIRVTLGGDIRTRFDSVMVFYRLQVSPAPSTATFNDVPTGHPFLPFIEALVAAGITTGRNAAPPMYCPDEFVTRKQMAAFLARALGLHWAP